MIARVMLLIAAGFAFVVVAGLPARHLVGDHALILCGAAVLLCLVPGILTTVLVSGAIRHDPRQGPLLVFGASGVRMFVVLGAAVLLYFQVPFFREQDAFLFWVLVAYLYLLAVEVVLVVRAARGPMPTMTQSSERDRSG